METFRLTFTMRPLQKVMQMQPIRLQNKMPTETLKQENSSQNNAKSFTLKPSIFEKASKNSVVYCDDQKKYWQLTIFTEIGGADEKSILNGQFHLITENCESMRYKFGITIKHPKDESLSIKTEYEEILKDDKKDVLKKLTDKTFLEENGFFADNNETIVFEYFVKPINERTRKNSNIRGAKANPKERDMKKSKPENIGGNQDWKNYHDMKINFKKVEESSCKFYIIKK